MNRRQRMWASNKEARNYMIKKMDCSHVYFKEHTRRKSLFYNPDYKATDFFNLFDGLCFHDGSLCFFQVKTDQAWPKREPIDEFLHGKFGFGVFAINVRPDKKPRILVKWYTLEMEAR